ncbi:MAG: hypothetical protein LBS52_09290 [Dysgonamonadaceae bacterium]|nr:hypothetical protein [Dysgonamonadaceae bacterium]
MDAMQLDVQKAKIAREILNSTDENLITQVWLFLKDHHNTVQECQPKKKRELGFLKGKAKVVFHDDFQMAPEELGMV